jgi:hypothetical protein
VPGRQWRTWSAKARKSLLKKGASVGDREAAPRRSTSPTCRSFTPQIPCRGMDSAMPVNHVVSQCQPHSETELSVMYRVHTNDKKGVFLSTKHNICGILET